MKLIFTGDMMLGGDFLDKTLSIHNFDPNLFKDLQEANYVINSFENVIGHSQELRNDKDSLLYCTPKTLESYHKLLSNLIFCLGNNHITDFGLTTFNETLELLKKYDIKYYGAGFLNEARIPLIIEENVALLHFSTDEFYVNSNIAKIDKVGCCFYDYNEIINIIEKYNLKKYFLIITFHWGYERIILPSPNQVNLAHKLIDAGVDLIIGHHPHIIQPYEVYKGKHIFYSLGNYFFPNFFRYRTGIYHRWGEISNNSILVKIEINQQKSYSVDIIGLKFSTQFFKILIDSKVLNHLHNISNIFQKIYNKDRYNKIFKNIIDKNYSKMPNNTIKAFVINLLAVFNILNKNKYTYRERVKKFTTIQKIIKIIKLIADFRNWCSFDANMVNRLFYF